MRSPCSGTWDPPTALLLTQSKAKGDYKGHKTHLPDPSELLSLCSPSQLPDQPYLFFFLGCTRHISPSGPQCLSVVFPEIATGPIFLSSSRLCSNVTLLEKPCSLFLVSASLCSAALTLTEYYLVMLLTVFPTRMKAPWTRVFCLFTVPSPGITRACDITALSK